MDGFSSYALLLILVAVVLEILVPPAGRVIFVIGLIPVISITFREFEIWLLLFKIVTYAGLGVLILWLIFLIRDSFQRARNPQAIQVDKASLFAENIVINAVCVFIFLVVWISLGSSAEVNIDYPIIGNIYDSVSNSGILEGLRKLLLPSIIFGIVQQTIGLIISNCITAVFAKR
jgi:hypothetical protein